MYCNSCGSLIGSNETVCQRCGTNVIGARADVAARTRVAGNLQLIAIFWYVVAASFVIPTVIMLALSGVASAALRHEQVLPSILGSGLFILLALLFVAHGLAAFFAGYGLHTVRPWGRGFAIAVAFWMLLSPPFGTLLGIYTLVVLLPAAAGNEYQRMCAERGNATAAKA